MLSSTLALGLLFVLFIDTIARHTHENPVISYAEQLRTVGPPGVHINSTKSKHAASDSSNPSSWPKDNVKRALNSTATRNISSVETLRPALVDNSSDLVEATKSTLVVNEITDPTCTCYGSRTAAPIATPSNCNVAIYEIISAGDPEEGVLWRGQTTWTCLTCKVELVPRAESSEYMTRRHLAQAAAVIKRDCVTPEHGYRGGYIAVGSRMIFDLKVWASTSSVTVNETTSASPHLLESPGLLEIEADSL